MELPAKDAPFAEKMEYYRSQHKSEGIRITHLIGIPTVVFSLPLLLFRPRLGLRLFIFGWSLQLLGHRVFEKNAPAFSDGLEYQLAGVAFWCEEVADMVSGAARREQEASYAEATSA